jgi:predicted NBD/HSP70 family sugar kinase
MVKPPLRGNRDLIKAMNRNLILNIVRREGSLSRTQLTEVSGLSVGAVSQIINDLIENNWILEVGEGDYTGGRRQVLLRLNPTAGYAIGLKLMEKRVVCTVTDFEGQMLHYQGHSFDISDLSPEGTTRALVEIVNLTMSEVGFERGQMFGVGIGLAGVVYSHAGVVHYSPFLGWRNVPLADMVSLQLGIPVYVENDVNTLTLSEHLFGAGRHQSHFIVVTVGRGIGMGIVINGQIYRGANGGAGEIGHTVLDLPHARRFGVEAGSLEGLAADAAVVQYARVQRKGQKISLDEIVASAAEGDEIAREALEQSGEWLGVGLAAAINILCPALVIVSGEGVAAGDFRLKPMLAAMRRYTFNGLLDDVQVVVKPADDRAWARGAASLVISKVFESPLVEGKTVS